MTVMARPLAGLLELLFPSVCVYCGQSVIPGQYLCDACGSSLKPTGLGNWVKGVTEGQNLDGVWSAFWFDERLQQAIHALKYEGLEGIAADLIRHAAAGDQTARLRQRFDVLIPVPLHRTKFRERGYNQSLLLAQALGKAWNLPVDETALLRRRWTDSQTGLTADERVVNMAGSFEVRPETDAARALLVDDVVTTGATASACAQALKGAGYATVGVFSIATPPVER